MTLDPLTGFLALIALLLSGAAGLYTFYRSNGVRGVLSVGALFVVLSVGVFLLYCRLSPAPKPEPRAFVGEREVLTALSTYLSEQGGNATHLRFLTLTHLHNNPHRTQKQLKDHRQALEGLLQTLGHQGKLRAIDPDETVFALDVRQLGKVGEETWDRILKVNPYGLRLDRHPDQVLRELAEKVYRLTGSNQPAVRGDWLIASLSRPPLASLLPTAHTPAALARQLTEITRQYDSDLGLEEIASELSQSDPASLKSLLVGCRCSHRIGLHCGPAGVSVTRANWEGAAPLFSGFQTVAQEALHATPSQSF